MIFNTYGKRVMIRHLSIGDTFLYKDHVCLCVNESAFEELLSNELGDEYIHGNIIVYVDLCLDELDFFNSINQDNLVWLVGAEVVLRNDIL